MVLAATDMRLFQMLRIDGRRLRYRARTAMGGPCDAIDPVRDGAGRQPREPEDGRIPLRVCRHPASPEGCNERCWE
ncbi:MULTISPECIES: hypothetical protein [Stenotrophomonas]|uniref:Uncharacterized protein n=1 Tax=Stenotrophomonas nitritireducens TaxID=83617 RepID=A0ABR5NNK7_9GAMM|nr:MULTISPECIES: hypothetical protein [Stenotrophomonas]KQN98179.1 hypothetical protein ASF01_09980 [Stenotrophomonas sp. Leaf70]KRG60314.1 hypothetical protein ABB22_02870 [Stenotrophomonas nitritireducens]